MTPEERQRLVMVARRARKIVEALRKKEVENGNKIFPSRLNGMCARASTILFTLLSNEGFNPTICFGDGHCFLEVENLVVDITATQFGYGKVLIEPIEKMAAKPQWDSHPSLRYDSVEVAMLHQRDWKWPNSQRIKKKDLEFAKKFNG